MALHHFWIARSPFDIGGLAERFGITAHSLADALDLLVWSGFRMRADGADWHVSCPSTWEEFLALPGFRRHVEYNMGPLACRGLWYPWVTAIPPAARSFRMAHRSAVAPPPKLAACLAALERAVVRLRVLGYRGEAAGLAREDSVEISLLADAVHNLPYLIQHWDVCDEELLRGMLADYDDRFPDSAGLLDAYERAERAASDT